MLTILAYRTAGEQERGLRAELSAQAALQPVVRRGLPIGEIPVQDRDQGRAVSKASLSHLNNRVSSNAPEAVNVKPEQYGVANLSDLQLHSPELVAGSYTEAADMYQQLIARRPELKDQLQILSSYEIEAG